MAQIISWNIENKKNIAHAIAVLYSETNKISTYIQDMLLERLMWAVTENNDEGIKKKYAVPYRSEDAINKEIEIRHEHAVPKKILVQKILRSNKTEEEVFEILDKYAHAVVVTPEEHQKLSKMGFGQNMPLGADESDITNYVFSRYKEADIKIYDTRNNERVV